MVLVVTGIAQESKIAFGPGVSHVVCSGSRPEHLRAQLSDLKGDGLRAVISFGIAGGLDPARRPGDIVLATAVIGESGLWKVSPPLLSALSVCMHAGGVNAVSGPLVGVERVVMGPAAKEALRRETDAAAVDMESHIGAAYAAHRGLPFAAIRVISDPAHRALPPVTDRALKPDGRIDTAAVLSGLMRAPSQIATLIQTASDAGRAFAGLRRCRRLLDFSVDFSFANL